MEKLSSIIPRIPLAFEGEKKSREQLAFWAYYSSVGERMSEELKPVGLRGDILLLECANPHWEKMLKNHTDKEQLLFKINRNLTDFRLKKLEIVN